MTQSCPVCGLTGLDEHFVVTARCRARWRGKSFDADAALGNLGLALADVLGITPRDFEEFQRRVQLRALREDLDENPSERFDPAEGERWEFHVGLSGPPPGTLPKAQDAAVVAIASSRNFEDARLNR